MTRASDILEDLDLMHSAVLVEGRTHSLGKAKVNESKADKSHQFVKSAIDRIKTGMKYGDDMKSSAKVAYKDAVSLLQKAIKELKESALEEAKTPSAAVSNRTHSLGKAKVNESKADKSHQFVKSAIDRIKTGMKYGDDMKSSAKVAYKDAVSLLQKAIKELKESALEEAKTPSAAVSKAMNNLIVELRQFYMFDEIGKENIRDFKKFEDSIVKFAKKYNL